MDFFGELLVGLLQFFGELLIEFLVETLFGVGIRRTRTTFARGFTLPPMLAVIAYALLGGAVGALSVRIWPDSFVHARWARLVVLFAAPVLVGLAMSAIGAWRKRRDQELIRLDRFGYAFLFAFAMGLARFVWAR